MEKRIYNLEFFKNLAINNNGECLSTEYIACDKNIPIILDNSALFK